MYYCKKCDWEGKNLKQLVNLDKKEIEYFEGCPKCHSDDISVLNNPKEELTKIIKRHLKGIEKAVKN